MRKEELNFEIGQRLRDVRLNKNLSIEDLAFLFKISAEHLTRIENGDKGIEVPELQRISELFDFSIDWLVSGVRPKKIIRIRDCELDQDTLILSIMIDDMKSNPIIRIKMFEAYENILKAIDNQKVESDGTKTNGDNSIICIRPSGNGALERLPQAPTGIFKIKGKKLKK